jgi:Ca2+-binding RTX toxin-like protein
MLFNVHSRITNAMVLGVAVGWSLEGDALAVGGTCPPAFDAFDCSVTEGATTQDVCWVDVGVLASGGDRITCSAYWTTVADATISMVSNYISAGHTTPVGTIQAWGYVNGTAATGGVGFCCSISASTQYPCEADNLGSDYGDTLRMQYTLAGVPTTYSEDACANIVHGYYGNDHILGSTHSGGWDTLYGEEDQDTISGDVGGDTIWGGDGDDTLRGGADNDFIYGEDDHDVITGGSGNDHIWGGADVDYISGNSGDDTIDGGTSGDVICGGAPGLDTLIAGDTTADGDQLYAATAGSSDDCGNTDTAWDNIATTTTSCGTTYLAAEPTACP